MDDVRSKNHWMEARQRGGGADSAAEMASAWRTLCAMRDGAAAEAAALRSTIRLLPTDMDDLLAGARAAYTGLIMAAAEEAAEMSARLAHHRSAGVAARLSGAWRAGRTRLADEAASAASLVERLRGELPHRERDFRAAAIKRRDINLRLNKQALAQVAPLEARARSLTLAAHAVRAGDESAKACLQRQDFDALERVARIWDRLKQDGFVGDGDWAYYGAARGQPPADGAAGRTAMPAAEVLMRLLEAVASGVHPARGGAVVDAEWSEIPGRAPPNGVQRRTLLPRRTGRASEEN